MSSENIILYYREAGPQWRGSEDRRTASRRHTEVGVIGSATTSSFRRTAWPSQSFLNIYQSALSRCSQTC